MKSETDWFKLLMTLGLSIALVPWLAFVATVMWGWFVVPLGVAAIGKAHAYGLVTMIGLVKNYDLTEKETATDRIVVGALVPAIVLLAGYIAHGFMQ